MVLRALDVYRQPITRPCRWRVTTQQSPPRTVVQRVTNGEVIVTGLALAADRLLRVEVHADGYQPVSRFVWGHDLIADVVCPVDPARVVGIVQRARPWPNLDRPGALLSDTRPNQRERVACLLNLTAKWHTTTVSGAPVASFIQRVTRVERDRVWARVHPGLLGALHASSGFRRVSGVLHDPITPDYTRVGSFKETAYATGTLQITLFRHERRGIMLADCDIDEANGLRHLFHVIGRRVTKGKTHPYVIHQILVHSQRLDPGYQLTLDVPQVTHG